MQLGNLRTQLLERLALHRLNGSLRVKKNTPTDLLSSVWSFSHTMTTKNSAHYEDELDEDG